MVRCAIWHHLYNLKNVKNALGGVLNLVKLQAEALLAYMICLVLYLHGNKQSGKQVFFASNVNRLSLMRKYYI